MNAYALKREIDLLLHLSGMSEVEFWRAARTAASSAPVPIPYPNIATGEPVTVQGGGEYFDGQYVVTSVAHNIDSGSYSDSFGSRRLAAGHKFTLERHFQADLIRCVLAAASGDQAAAQARQVWIRTKPKIQQLDPSALSKLVQELSMALQRGRRRQ